MRQKVLNTFTGGVDRDTSAHFIKQDRADKLVNFRLLDVSGNSYAVTSVKGNEFVFELTDGFIPLGGVDYNGIGFIFSFNGTTGEGEVGTYPSPLLGCAGGFEHVYRALQNWNGAVDPATAVTRLDLRTALFNFDCSRQIDATTRIDYDGSVNLYFADWRNPLRRLNCGFDIKTGICNDRMLWTGNFEPQTNSFFETCGHPDATAPAAVELIPGGALQYGAYYIYSRYKDISFNATSWLGEEGPIDVNSDPLSLGTTVDGGEGLQNAGRSIRITFSNIDSAFPYLELGVAYCYDGTFELGIIDVLYPIPQGATSMTITISGTETLVDMTIADLIRRKDNVDCPRTLDQLDNRLWASNWKERDRDFAAMETLALACIIKPQDPGELTVIVDEENIQQSVPLQYKDYNNVRNNLGYFRGECYAFAIVFVYNGGGLSLPYPMQGYDAWYDPGAATLNPRGILRMPSNMNAGYAYYAVNQARILGAKLDTSGAPLPQWVLDNVCGFYIVRAERRPTLVYQGHVASCWDAGVIGTGTIVPPTPGEYDVTFAANTWIPEFDDGSAPYGRRFPSLVRSDGGIQTPDNTTIRTFGENPVASVNAMPDKYGIFSFDHFFLRSLNDGLYTVVKQGDASMSLFNMATVYGSARDPSYYHQQNGFTPDPSTSNDGKVQLYNVADNARVPTGGGFVAGYYEGTEGVYNSGLPVQWHAKDVVNGFGNSDELGNRAMRQRNYIAASFSEAGTDPAFSAEMNPSTLVNPVVNVYNTDPDPANGFVLINMYNPGQTQYYKVSGFIPLAEWGNMLQVQHHIWNGDCFLQRAMNRHLSWDGTGLIDSAVNGQFYRYGSMASLIQECANNVGMRHQDGDARYYPEEQPTFALAMASDYGQFEESRLLNEGYNRTLGLISALGNDATIPFRGLRFPCRTRFSQAHVPNSYSDAYLRFDLDAYKDFDHSLGEIVSTRRMDANLISVQEWGIIQHIVNAREALPTGSSEGGLLVGTGEVLSDKAITITAEYGSQHQWSIIRTDRALYGWDQNKRAAWSYGPGTGFRNLSQQFGFRSDTVDLSEIASDHSDILHGYLDSPVCTEGIVGWWDRKYADVGWTFVADTLLTDTPPTMRYDTVVFNELQQVYMHRRTHNSPFYLQINEDFFSIDPARVGVLGTNIRGRFYQHDSDAVPHYHFYGTQSVATIGYACNAASPMVTKVFDAIQIAASDRPAQAMRVFTEFQSYTLSPFMSANEWETPKYNENQWYIPALRATAVIGGGVQEYLADSRMRGPYYRAELDWTSGEPISVRTVISTLRPSNT